MVGQVGDTSQLPARQKMHPSPGSAETFREYLRRMIVYSDNQAWDNLLQRINPEKYYRLFDDMELPRPDLTRGRPYWIGAKDYATFFHILYNASYLRKGYSEEALALLAQTKYQAGLVAGVPQGVEVAHKFGERFRAEDDEIQLHDCGVVYYPKNPYLLCIMTQGKRGANLTGVVKSLSEMIYKEVDAQYKRGGFTG